MLCKKCSKDIPESSAYCCWCGTSQAAPQRKRNYKRRGTGQGTVYRRGRYWQCEVVIGYKPDGTRKRRYKSGFETKKSALEYLSTLASASPQQLQRTPTVEHYYESLNKSDLVKLSKSKQCAYRIAWRKMEAIKDLPVSSLSIVMLRDLVADEAPTFYPARDMKTLLSKIITLAIADQQLNINIAEYITLPKLDESEREAWTSEELAVIWNAFDQEDVVAAYLLLMIYTGMMPGELDLCRRGMIHLDERKIVGAGIKTEIRKKEAPIVIADLLIPVIDRILSYTSDDADSRILYTDRWSFYGAYHQFTAAWNLRDLPMYSCRHTTATALAVGTDVAPSIIQKIMRHAKYTTTQRYIHPDSSDAIAGVNKLTRAGK